MKSHVTSLPQFILEVRCYFDLFREMQSALSMLVGWSYKDSESESIVTVLKYQNSTLIQQAGQMVMFWTFIEGLIPFGRLRYR